MEKANDKAINIKMMNFCFIYSDLMNIQDILDYKHTPCICINASQRYVKGDKLPSFLVIFFFI